MRKLLAAAFWMCCAVLSYSQTANTIITGTYTSPSGPNPSGTLTISWTRFQNDAVPKQTVYPGRIVVTITSGVIPNVSLFPNAAALPTSTCYAVSAVLGGVTSQRYWTVPISATPVDVDVVEGSIPCSPGTSATISPSQIANAGATLGQVLAWNGYYWAPANGGGSGGSPLFSSILSGVNNSNQTFTMANGILNATGGIIAANQILTTPITSLLGNSGVLVQGTGPYTNGDTPSFDSGGNLVSSGIPAANMIVNTGTYANPAWITSLSAAKLTLGTLPCAALPGTTGDVTQSTGSCATVVTTTSGTPFAPSATMDTTIASNVTSGVFASARIPAINLAASGTGGVTGNLQQINFNGGFNANSSTCWVGNMTWQTCVAGGTVTHTFGPLTAGAVAIGNNGNDINVLSSLGLTGQTLHANPLGSPNWALTTLTTDVTGVLPGANGGTNTAFLQFAGPTVLRTYTGPDANATLLTSNAPVTLAQGGLGANFSSIALGGMITGTGAGTVGITAVGANGKVWTANSGAAGGADWETAAAGGTVTSIVFSSPLTGGTITTSGMVGCTICVTSAAALTANQLVIGAGSQGSQTLGSLGTTTQVLIGNAGGAPAWGALNLATMITGFTPLANGGLNANLTASNGGIFYSTTSAGAVLSGTSTANQLLMSGVSSAPSWSTATYPATTTINQLLYSSSANVVSGLVTANNGVLVTNGSGMPSISTSALPFASRFPSGTQTQTLKIQPNAGNSSTVEWATEPGFIASDYNFPAQSPSGSLTGGVQATVTLSPCPLGVLAGNTIESLYIGGTGTPEAVQLQAGGSCAGDGITTGTVEFTPSGSHGAGFTISSATAGWQEAVNYVFANAGGNVGTIIGSANNVAVFHAQLTLPPTTSYAGFTFTCLDPNTTCIQRASDYAAGDLINLTATGGSNAQLHLLNLHIDNGTGGNAVHIVNGGTATIDNSGVSQGASGSGVGLLLDSVGTVYSWNYQYFSSSVSSLGLQIIGTNSKSVVMNFSGGTFFVPQGTGTTYAIDISSGDNVIFDGINFGGASVPINIHSTNSAFNQLGALRISKCSFDNYYTNAIRLVNSGGTVDGIQIIDNPMSGESNGTNTWGIDLGCASGASYLNALIVGNIIQQNGFSGVCIGGTGDGFEMTGNIFKANNTRSQAGEGAYRLSSVPAHAVISSNSGVDDVIPALASASTFVFPINPVFTITGTTGITAVTMSSVVAGARGILRTTSGAVTFTAGGGIGNTFTTTQNVPVTWIWDGTSLWLR